MNKVAVIVGNGPSRVGMNLMIFKDKATVYGCNALYRDFKPLYLLPDYLVAIDPPIIKEIENSDFPKHRFIVPPWEEQFEDIEYRVLPRMRSNAGMNAMLEAIKDGHNILLCLGFDFLINDPLSLDNVYGGTSCYTDEFKATEVDVLNRVRYMNWFAKKYSNVKFVFVIDPHLEYHKLDAKNILGVVWQDVLKEYS